MADLFKTMACPRSSTLVCCPVLTVRLHCGAPILAAALMEGHAAIRRQEPSWIPGHLPSEPIGIGKIARVTSPGSLARRLQNRCAGGCGTRHEGINLLLRTDVVAQRHGRLSELLRIGLKIGREPVAQEKGEDHSAGLEKDNLFVFKRRFPAE